MATVDEILATMAETSANETMDAVLVIDANTRQISIPGSELIFGVVSDENAERKYFLCPRYVGNGLDLTSCFLRVNYRNANGQIDAHLITDVALTEDGENITFSWELARKVTQYKGQVTFVVCACRPGEDGKLLNEWNTTHAVGSVLDGLEPTNVDVTGATTDVITQLITMVETQTENVKTEGAIQVAVVRTAAENAESDAVAQIEAKGASTLATIPEDYTAMGAKVNEFANAVKGNLSGVLIRGDDVSPVEHYPAVKVTGYNLFNPAVMAESYESNGLTITRNGDEITINGTATTTFACPVIPMMLPIKKGESYTCTVFRLSGTGNWFVASFGEGVTSGVRMAYYDCSSLNEPSNYRTFVAKYDYVTSFMLHFDGGVSFDNLVIKIQLAQDAVSAEYVPYVDPATMTLRRYGKNLLGGYTTSTVNGVTFTVQENGAISVQGTATGDAGLNSRFKLGAGTYTVSGDLPDSVALDGDMYVWASVTQGIIARSYTGSTIRTFTLPSESYVDVYIRVKSGRVCKGELFYPQIEAGTEVTAFATHEPAVSYTPDSNGVVGSLTSLAPTMTLLTDTTGATVECTYNRDTNKVIAEILEKITALGG